MYRHFQFTIKLQPDQLFLLAQNRAGLLPGVAQSFYLLEKQLVTTWAIWYPAYCYAGTYLLAVCACAHTSKARWCPHIIISFLLLTLLCTSGFFFCFCWVLSTSCSQLVPDLTTCLQLSCQLQSLETQVERGFIFFSFLFFFVCVKYSLHSYQTAWIECVSTGKQLCDFGLTLKFLNIHFCFRRMFFILSFILTACPHTENQDN